MSTSIGDIPAVAPVDSKLGGRCGHRWTTHYTAVGVPASRLRAAHETGLEGTGEAQDKQLVSE